MGFDEHSRSRSRGRSDHMISTGRGGAGNMRSSSQSKDRSGAGDDTLIYQSERGRSPHLPSVERVQHSGRGGAGNIRSPSRDPKERERELSEQAYETQVIEARRREEAGRIHSAGRGGAGNMRSRSQSRDAASRSPLPDYQHGQPDSYRAAQSGGRGGYGNQYYPRDSDVEGLKKLDEEDERARASWEESHPNEIWSSGKGGAGNIQRTHTNDSAATTPEEFDEAKAIINEGKSGHMSGRGGAGNFVAESRGRSQGTTNGSNPVDAVKRIFRSLSRSGRD
ncbi:Protein of unknown function DUF3602 [Phaffia rhodozyma]|uniref:Uncharacterized protein n=1 Tax=Phaffia rhodozyma TaxID=264483 RepID=A0A0F7SU67_PHARH|nr:Protein of unknown function DUF3602 [Phaffia rhodozyma]